VTIIDPGTPHVESTPPDRRPDAVSERKALSQLWLVLAICCECGETHAVHRRRSVDVRPLRCDNCKRTTLHARIGNYGNYDFHEEDNERIGLKPPDALGAVEVLRALGARVTVKPFKVGSHTGIVDVLHYLDDKTFHVSVNPDAALEDIRVSALEVAERIKRPDLKAWYVETDEDGVPFAFMTWVR